MGGFVLRGAFELSGEAKYHNPYHLTSEGILTLLNKEHIDQLPDISEAEIKDKSKGDMFVKAIAVGQIVWSIIQIIGRGIKRLPVSPLEVAVVAFAVCAVITHGLYWYKPQRVGTTTTIHLKETSLTEDGAIPKAVLEALNDAQQVKRLFGSIFSDAPLPGSPISLDTNVDADGSEMLAAMGGATVFGAIHVVAWNFAFPSRIELIFWRCTSIFTTAASLGFILLGVPDSIMDTIDKSKHPLRQLRKVSQSLLPLGSGLIIPLYIVARLFIIVEMFRTLCFLPPGSYISTWTSNIPHVG
ncbi:uncharacterized protein Triagg1_531 [Trichoderma aggressivum f. europaeum]|uniref:Uncharacterized protein n=1 Tax=Trichoderma aggressivum f. europaeum TaxID=173218 RepID=A0AAE1MA82_9HYPO|nr:hypothetical protein Triagg1_531 [Trichoderma aggressivum f. europaeum]